MEALFHHIYDQGSDAEDDFVSMGVEDGSPRGVLVGKYMTDGRENPTAVTALMELADCEADDVSMDEVSPKLVPTFGTKRHRW